MRNYNPRNKSVNPVEEDFLYKQIQSCMYSKFSLVYNKLESEVKKSVLSYKVEAIKNNIELTKEEINIKNEEIIEKNYLLYKKFHSELIKIFLAFFSTISEYKRKKDMEVEDRDLLIESIKKMRLFFNVINFVAQPEENDMRNRYFYYLLKKDSEFLRSYTEMQRKFMSEPEDFKEKVTRTVNKVDERTITTHGLQGMSSFEKFETERQRRKQAIDDILNDQPKRTL